MNEFDELAQVRNEVGRSGGGQVMQSHSRAFEFYFRCNEQPLEVSKSFQNDTIRFMFRKDPSICCAKAGFREGTGRFKLGRLKQHPEEGGLD